MGGWVDRKMTAGRNAVVSGEGEGERCGQRKGIGHGSDLSQREEV